MSLWTWFKQQAEPVVEVLTGKKRRPSREGKRFSSISEAVHYRDPDVWRSGDARPFEDFVRGREGDFR